MSAGEQEIPVAAPTGTTSLSGALRRLALVAVALFAFVLALELLKKGAGGVVPLLRGLEVSGLSGGLGIGWLLACVLLSGSPVAAIALTLLASGTVAVDETFAMVAGSRLGASFVVLVVGVLDDLRRSRSEKRGAYVGVAALLVTGLVYLPAIGLGYTALQNGLFAGLRLEGGELASFLAAVYGPMVGPASRLLPPFVLFVAGVLCLLGSFKVFDLVLPALHARETPVSLVGRVVYRPWAMFLIGFAVTAMTLSVSVSLSLLVPLTAKGYVRRENVCPYILGANISTFIDTLFAGALVGHPDAVQVVAVLMASVTAVSLPVIVFFPHRFERLVDHLARRVTRSRGALLAFTTALLLVPAALIAL